MPPLMTQLAICSAQVNGDSLAELICLGSLDLDGHHGGFGMAVDCDVADGEMLSRVVGAW